MIHLDKRLARMAGMMTAGGRGIDVGTDHGYLAVSLVQQGIAASMIATDINEAPLRSAQSCIRENELEDKIETVLTDGLQGVDLSGVTDIFIAGMGGILITEILAARLSELQDKNLILQPMTQAPALRAWLLEHGFAICKERCAAVGGKAYSIINARFDGEKRTCDLLYGLIGRSWEDESEDAEIYLQTLLARQQKVLRGLQQAENADPEKLIETRMVIDRLQELLRKRNTKEEHHVNCL